MLCDSLNIDKHYGNLARVFGVQHDDLYEFAKFDTTEAATAAAIHAHDKLLAEIKSQKEMRRESIDRTMLTIIEFIAELLGIRAEELVESIVDCEIKTGCLQRFFPQNGSEAFILSFSSKVDNVNRIDVVYEKEYIQTDQCAIVYRIDRSGDITLKNMTNVSKSQESKKQNDNK